MLLYGSLSQGHYTNNKGTKSTYTQVVVGSIYFVKQETLSDEMLAKLDKINEEVTTQDDRDKQLKMEELKMCDDFESELYIFYDLNGDIVGASVNPLKDEREILPFV